MTRIIKEKIMAIASHYGFKHQSLIAIEELSELQKAICKWQRKYAGVWNSGTLECQERTDIIEELADVMIMAEQLIYLTGAEAEVDRVIKQKLNRQLKRIEEEDGR